MSLASVTCQKKSALDLAIKMNQASDCTRDGCVFLLGCLCFLKRNLLVDEWSHNTLGVSTVSALIDDIV